MPSIIGNIKIVSMGSSGVAHLGDAIQLSPQATSKTYSGSGSSNTGDFPRTFNAISATNTNDPDVIDAAEMDAGNQGVV
ncbi:spore germination protein [Paenibacillus alkalitolerans]|uniref:spore germination protein n=1 Tax=Paenibacillus alkalitolerans TaxID=2799335 RepID=UPI0018F4468C|nr:spore germination protein [Paenibacillus alkalitolerans]